MVASSIELWVPPLPILPVKSYLAIDATTGQILAKKNITSVLPAGSLLEVLTLYELEENYLARDTKNNLPPPSQNTRSTSVFNMTEILKKLYASPTQKARTALLETLYQNRNIYAESLQKQCSTIPLSICTITHDATEHLTLQTTSHDLALLTQKLYPKFSQRYDTFSHENAIFIKKNLSFNDPRIRYAYFSKEPFNLIVYTEYGQQSVIIIVMGAKNTDIAAQTADVIANYVYKFYKKITIPQETLLQHLPTVWRGKGSTVRIAPLKYSTISVPKSLVAWKPVITWHNPLLAPIQQHDTIGILQITTSRNQIIYQEDIIAADNVDLSYFHACIHTLYLYFTNAIRTKNEK